LLAAKAYAFLVAHPTLLRFVKAVDVKFGLISTISKLRRKSQGRNSSKRIFETKSEWLDQVNRIRAKNLERPISKKSNTLYIVSPVPPAKSGVAKHAELLGSQLQKKFDVVFVSDAKSPTLSAGIKHISGEDFIQDWAPGDKVIYQVGNSPLHAFQEKLMEQIPGILDLHDPSLRDLALYKAQGHLHEPELIQKVVHEVGWGGLATLPADSTDLPDLNSHYRHLAIHTIVHSESARRRIRQAESSHSSNDDIDVIPLGKPIPNLESRITARKKMDLKESDFLIVSFGFLSENKYSDELAASVARIHRQGLSEAKIHLVYAGEDPPKNLKRRITKLFKENEFDDFEFTGWLADDSYALLLSAANLCVQLRKPHGGESSAAVVDSLLAGLPTIVSQVPANDEIPDECVIKSSLANLDQSITWVIHNQDQAKQIAKAGQVFARNMFNIERVSTKYEETIQRTYQNHRFDQSENVTYVEKNKLFVDVTAIHENDLGTGIQRVVRKITSTWLTNLGFDELDVTPVHFDSESGKFFTSERIRADFLGWRKTVFADREINPHSGDIFLGLDLVFNNVQHETLLSWRKSGVRIFFVVYDLLPMSHPEYFPQPAVTSFGQWAEMTTKYDGILAISSTTASEYRRIFPNLNHDFLLETFELGSDSTTERVHLRPQQTPVVANNEIQFIMVGTIEPRKGHLEVVRAFIKLWDEHKLVRLTIVGKWGWLSQRDRKYLEDASLKFPKLQILTDQSDSELAGHYEKSHCLIAASYAEGYGLPIVEASQHGIKVFARDIPIFREVALEGASYFNTAQSLDEQILDWIEEFKAGEAADSNLIPTTSWKVASTRLYAKLSEVTSRMKNDFSGNV
jgi:glycosyltransferase involved in cell wall biosynthesis